MATYDNDLRLKEITTGDEDGTWGDSTNTNLELIADGFSYGTKEMAADANETFTMPDATADATRSLYLKFTSAVSLTATRVVTLGPNTVSKTWIIENATSGSQIITIKQGSGATVDVANGDKTMVVTDGAGAGAAVLNANPSGTTGTVTSVGGTGTVNGLTLTGTVTSSGNLTLGGTLDDIDLTSGVTGTLPVANGGTGATSLTANNVLLGNGTSAPQAVAPSTSGNVLTSNGSTWTSAAPGGGGSLQVVTFSSSTTWTPPTGVDQIYAEVVGGGGGAPVASGASSGGGGLAMGSLAVTPGVGVSITVGAGGAGGGSTYGTPGSPGGFSRLIGPSNTLLGNGGVSTGTGGSASGGNRMNIKGQQGTTQLKFGGQAYFAPESSNTRNAPGVGGYSTGNAYGSPGSAGKVFIWYVG